MRNNFDINIPTIPGKTIKFKIQDIKTTAFGSQKNRFQQNKGFLTKKFIDSFNNFQQKKRQPEQQTQAQSRVQIRTAQRKNQEMDYRLFVPEEKKHMLYHVDKYKNYQASLLKETKYNRGFSFNKTDSSLPRYPRKTKDNSLYEPNRTVSDNYFFPSTRTKDAAGDVSIKKNAPSSVFKNQTRDRVYTKLEAKANSLGPGQYLTERKEEKTFGRQKMERVRPRHDVDYNRLKRIITNIVVNEPDNAIIQEEDEKKELKPNYMFLKDDRDRFGDQKYPIVPRNIVPGPGAYAIKNSIEEQAHKVLVVEEQRKLLKDWFNN